MVNINLLKKNFCPLLPLPHSKLCIYVSVESRKRIFTLKEREFLDFLKLTNALVKFRKKGSL